MIGNERELIALAEASKVNARAAWDNGNAADAISAARYAVDLYAVAMRPCEDADDLRATFDELRDQVLRVKNSRYARSQIVTAIETTASRGAALTECAELLFKASLFAEAANMFQEAADLYGIIRSFLPMSTEYLGIDTVIVQSQYNSVSCADRVLACIRGVNEHHQDRLGLLISRYERKQRRLELLPQRGCLTAQADIAVHIARIFERTERPADSVVRYEEALELYEREPEEDRPFLKLGECHHRIANLYANALRAATNRERGLSHYERAIELYARYEPFAYGKQSGLELCRQAISRL